MEFTRMSLTNNTKEEKTAGDLDDPEFDSDRGPGRF